MIRHPFFVATLLLIFNTLSAQSFSKCYEKYRKNPDGIDSIYIKTCYFSKYKFIQASYPDFQGRYYDSENEVYVLVNKKYIKIKNSKVFNKSQNELVSIINKRIQKDFKKFSTDTLTKECFTNIKFIPKYLMDDFEITFQKNEIWFEVNWRLSLVCLSVGGTAIPFKLAEIQKYLK